MTRDDIFDAIRETIGRTIAEGSCARDVVDGLIGHLALICSLNRKPGVSDDDIAALVAGGIMHKLASLPADMKLGSGPDGSRRH